MLKHYRFLVVALACLLPLPAFAGDRGWHGDFHRVGWGWGRVSAGVYVGPSYCPPAFCYTPAPAVVYSAPSVVYQPAPVYSQATIVSPPVVYQPAPAVVFSAPAPVTFFAPPFGLALRLPAVHVHWR